MWKYAQMAEYLTHPNLGVVLKDAKKIILAMAAEDSKAAFKISFIVYRC